MQLSSIHVGEKVEGVQSGFLSTGDDEDHKEVYARFGLAYYCADVLHKGLCNLYALASLPTYRFVTAPRFEERLKFAHQATFGQLVKRLQPHLPVPLFARLETAVTHRNFLAHDFWFERVYLFATLSGIQSMIDELDWHVELYHELDREADEIYATQKARVGIPEEIFANAIAEAMRGEPMEPWLERRRLHKEETVTAIFESPRVEGGFTIILKTDDGVLWQLCDAGLGWCTHEQADESWERPKELNEMLPVRIDPRPECVTPWHYDIALGKRTTLAVRPGSIPGKLLYMVTHSQLVKPT